MLIKTDENRTDLGYYMIDQRATGLLAPGGVTPLFESATYTCTHCERVVVMELTRTRPRYKCYGCKHLICDPCAAEKYADGGACKTYQQKLDEILTQEMRQSGVETEAVSPLILASS